MLLMQEKNVSFANLSDSIRSDFGEDYSRQYLHKGVCGSEKLSAEIYDMIAKVLINDFATIKELEKEPSYFIDSPTRIRDNEEYQDLTWEVLYEVEFGDPKHRSKMYKFTYDLIADFYRKSRITDVTQNGVKETNWKRVDNFTDYAKRDIENGTKYC